MRIFFICLFSLKFLSSVVFFASLLFQVKYKDWIFLITISLVSMIFDLQMSISAVESICYHQGEFCQAYYILER